MPERPPIQPPVTRYWRADAIEQGCISERTDIAADDPLTVAALSDEAERFENALLDAGLDFADAEIAARIFTDFSDSKPAPSAGDGVRAILESIASTKTGKTPEFRAILALFSPGRTLEDVASEAGLSRQSVHYHVEKLRPIFSEGPLR